MSANPKVTNLQAAMRTVAVNRNPTASSSLPDAPAIQEPPKRKPSSQAGKVHVGAYLNPEFQRTLRMAHAMTGKDMQLLLAEALNDLFRSLNLPVIDPNC
jgi:hypothetical protein